MTIKSLIGSASRPMTEDESMVFLNAMMSDAMNVVFDEAFAEELGFSGKVLERRLTVCSTAKITRGLALLLVVMSKGNPGNLVMWAYTMHCIAKGKDQILTISDFAEFFPIGVPSEEGLSATWDAQKDPIKGGNLIDGDWN